MKFKFNPITGDFDRVTGNGNYIQKLNPITGKFNLVDSADTYKQIINPLTGNFQLWNEGGGGEVLPAGYARLEYIESTGTQWIDLGISLKNTDDIEVVLQHTLEQAQSGVFGGRENASGNNISIIVTQTGNRLVTDFNNSSYTEYRYIMPSSMTANSIYKIILNKNERVIYDGDTLVGKNVTTNSDTISTPGCYLFTTYGYNSYNFIGKIYSVKIGNRMNLVPVMRTDHTVGMFDTVSQTFFTNSGTGEFTAGPFVLPDGYTEDEYYITKGSELPLGIDTGIKPTYGMVIKGKYSIFHNGSIYILGARAGQSEQMLTRPQTMTFSGSQNGGTITAFVGGSNVTAKTGTTNWSRISNVENKYEIDVTIGDYVEGTPTQFTVNFYDLINEVSDIGETNTFASNLDEFTPTIHLGGNGTDTEATNQRIYFLDLVWGTERRRYIPATYSGNTGFYEIFTHNFIS